MSFQDANDPECCQGSNAIDLLIEPREKDLGEFTVRRVLPAAERRMVGPFIFFDHMGPAEFPPGRGIQVRPHPHIGLATVTYLFEGEIMHADSLGFVQPIQARAVNLMTAGKGIVHSERAGADLDRHARLHGIQSWMALPVDLQERDPAFVHYPAADLPELDIDGVNVRVIIGEAYGAGSPVTAYSPMLYLELRMPGGSRIALPPAEERAFYVVEGSVACDGNEIAGGAMGVLREGADAVLSTDRDSHVMVIGGDNIGPRHIFWNFVSDSRERIGQARDDWREGRFDMVPGDDEFIPLP